MTESEMFEKFPLARFQYQCTSNSNINSETVYIDHYIIIDIKTKLIVSNVTKTEDYLI
jgi:hypothetical protein